MVFLVYLIFSRIYYDFSIIYFYFVVFFFLPVIFTSSTFVFWIFQRVVSSVTGLTICELFRRKFRPFCVVPRTCFICNTGLGASPHLQVTMFTSFSIWIHTSFSFTNAFIFSIGVSCSTSLCVVFPKKAFYVVQ